MVALSIPNSYFSFAPSTQPTATPDKQIQLLPCAKTAFARIPSSTPVMFLLLKSASNPFLQSLRIPQASLLLGLIHYVKEFALQFMCMYACTSIYTV